MKHTSINFLLSIVLIMCASCYSLNNRVHGDLKNGETDSNLGVASWSFHKFPFIQALEKTDSTGLHYVEISASFSMGKEFGDSLFIDLSTAGIQRAQKMLEEMGLVMASTYADGNSVNEWKRNFEFAKRLDLQYITGEPPVNLVPVIDSLAELYMIPVALHNHWKGLSYYWSPDTVLSIVNRFKNIKACADLGHWARSGLDPVECLKKLEGNVLGVHLKDIDKFGDIEANDVIFGHGVINFKEVVSALKQQNFQGMLYIECEYNWLNNVPDIRESVRFWDEIASRKSLN